jgi:hypothetical protein
MRMDMRIHRLGILVMVLVGFSLIISCSRDEPPVAPPPVVVVGDVLMNEVYSRGTAGNLDWVEIYNPNTVTVTLTGYKICDPGGWGTGATKPKKTFPAGATIAAKGYYVIVTDTADFTGDLSGFGLSSAGDQLWLENATGGLIDTLSFGAMDLTQTIGRYPDGAKTWQLLNTITKGASNKP